jgi:hypothetical protein
MATGLTVGCMAEKSRRRARAIEIDPAYVDVAIRRWHVTSFGGLRAPVRY